MSTLIRLAGLALTGLCISLAFAAPEAATPKAGGQTAILFLSTEPQLDKDYAAQLTQEGFSFTTAGLYTPLSPAFIKKFNMFVIDRLPGQGDEYGLFGQHMLPYWANMQVVWQCVQDGAGLLVYTNLADGGGDLAAGWNLAMKPYGIHLEQTCVLDRSLSFSKWMAYGENAYAWTENIARHPATEGVKRVYYPTANTRWDDCYTAPPLVCDANWTAIVQAMPGARTATLVDHSWIYEPETPHTPVLAAVRAVGKGRLGVLSINPAYTHRLGNLKLANNGYGEMSYGPIDGIILKKGDGTIPSDTGKLVSQLYTWLAVGSTAAHFGGYHTGDPVETVSTPQTEEEKAFNPVLDVDTMQMPKSWRHGPTPVDRGDTRYYPELSDPLVTGELHYFKGLVGAHSAFSDGQGSVDDFAAEAKKAGYSVIVFAENFEKLSHADFDKLLAACEKNSNDDFVCLPGIDIMDPDNNHFLIVAPPYYPRAGWLTPDGNRLAKTQMINLLYADHMVVAHKPESCPLPQERLKHFQGLSVYTYRAGKLVDDSLHAYAWQVINGANPHPVAVHEVFSPAEISTAAKTGFQQLMPSDTVRHAAGYFRHGIGHFFESPARYLISEGPIVTDFVINPKDCGPEAEGRMQFRVDVGVKSDVPLASVTLYDGFTVLRRWLPTGTEFQARADFRHSRQYSFYVIAEDSKGRRVITNSMRTVAEVYHERCGDRQNWLGHVANCYTGTDLPHPHQLDIGMPIKGTAEGSAIFTDVPGTCMAVKLNFPFTSNDVVLTEAILDEKYVTALFNDVGYDAMPSQASKPSSVYQGRVRNFAFAPGKDNKVYPNLVEIDLTLKRDVEPVDPNGLFPAFGRLLDNKYAWYDHTGKLVSGEIGAKDTLDVPVGGYAGGYVMLSEGLRVVNGRFGLAPTKDSPTLLPAGTQFHARLLVPASAMPWLGSKGSSFADPEKWLSAMGFADKAPFTLRLTRGKLEALRYLAEIRPEHFGTAGEVVGNADLPYWVPLHLTGMNANWPAGMWREDGSIRYSSVFEGAAYPRLDVSKKGKFYAGHLLTAGNPDLVLSIIKWDAQTIKVEVHNPTNAQIDTTIATPREITTLKSLTRAVSVPAGSTIYVTE